MNELIVEIGEALRAWLSMIRVRRHPDKAGEDLHFMTLQRTYADNSSLVAIATFQSQ
jgi:hypothetical protein